jgi:hypothetical protein
MLRWLYIQLIWLHPATFRWRFGDDMLDDFDRAALRAKRQYFADAVASLARQWLLRPEFRRPEATAATQAPLSAGALLFQTVETWKPHPAALIQGALLAVVSIIATVILIPMGGSPRLFVTGAHLSVPGLLPVDRNSLTARDLDTAVKVGPDTFDAWMKLGRRYFLSMPVLRALDTDRDFSLSPSEISNAPVALRNLEPSRVSRLTAGDCGLHFDPNSVPATMASQLRRRFMSYHPVLVTLDVDHDSEISAWEIDHAAAALKKLDRNSDGYLTAEELVPLEMAVAAGPR